VPGEALWAYCVARADDPLPGDTVEHGGLAALVAAVPLDEYGEEPLRRNLNDLAWLERVARGHEAVLERAMEGATIVPLRLCTIFDDEAGVRRMLDEQREALAAALDALAGRQEWSVKLLVDPEALRADAEDEPEGRGSGTAYLLRRRQERDQREVAGRRAAELAEDVHAALSAHAVAAVTNAPQNRQLSGHEGTMLLNGAYLVEAERVGELRELVGELRERTGARLELSGPFPPYNFAA
jgi:Gas vesicle synthesis protein GvpL/GvpF